MYDLKVVNGTVIDGTGGERFSADVAVKDGRVVEVGRCDGAAQETLNADGALVTPGFVDLHTHYDGQVSWDADLAPSSEHGVTTCVLGSCGVGFAPVRPTDHQRLIELMEGVEDIPGSALAEGMTWGWETFPEYMDRIDAFPHAIDFSVHVPHDALRMYVLGERAVAEEPATEEDVSQMQAILREALEAGAVGFSTGRTDNHRTAQGKPTPASEASERELVGLARALHGLEHGVLQVVSDFDLLTDPSRFDVEYDLIDAMASASDGHRLSLSLMQRDHAPDQWKWILRRAEAAHARGLPTRVQVAPRAIGVMLGLEATFNPFMAFPSYQALAGLPLAERVARMRDPEVRAQILKETSGRVSGEGSSLPPLADWFLKRLDLVGMRLFRLGEEPCYEPKAEQSIGAQAMAEGRPMLEVIYDALLERDGHALLYFPLYNYTGMNLDVVHEMLAHPLALPGLSDGGAHVGTICDASFPTFLLTHWGRDRATGRFALERLVQMQTHDTARHIGFTDRGTIAPGQKADLNIIDFDRLRLRAPRMQADLPAGGQRLLQDAEGYVATVVSGQIITRDGAFTGARPGRLVRLGQ